MVYICHNGDFLNCCCIVLNLSSRVFNSCLYHVYSMWSFRCWRTSRDLQLCTLLSCAHCCHLMESCLNGNHTTSPNCIWSWNQYVCGLSKNCNSVEGFWPILTYIMYIFIIKCKNITSLTFSLNSVGYIFLNFQI